MPKTYNELYITLRQRLREAGIDGYTLEARLLVACAAGKTPEQLLRDIHLYSSDAVEAQVEALAQRRMAGEPAAYITGNWGFYGLDFRVTPAVLIPRMDTEVLVATALDLLKPRTEAVRVLDLCTGSGCVGCAFAGKRPQSRVVLLDSSDEALEVAGENVRKLGLTERVVGVQLDVRLPPPKQLGSFDMILGNPPYVPSGELQNLDSSIRDYEPLSALDGGTDGLDFYRAILENWVGLVRQSGYMLLEVGEDQANEVSLLMRRSGLRSISTVQDTAGIDRVVFGKI